MIPEKTHRIQNIEQQQKRQSVQLILYQDNPDELVQKKTFTHAIVFMGIMQYLLFSPLTTAIASSVFSCPVRWSCSTSSLKMIFFILCVDIHCVICAFFDPSIFICFSEHMGMSSQPELCHILLFSLSSMYKLIWLRQKHTFT